MPDPYTILQLPETAGEEEIREAYLRLIRKYPPEVSPQCFQEVSDAYTQIRDDIGRARYFLFGGEPGDGRSVTELSQFAGSSDGERRPAGIDRWISAARDHVDH